MAVSAVKFRLRGYLVLAGGIQAKASVLRPAHQFLCLATIPPRHRCDGLRGDARDRAEQRTHHLLCGIERGFGRSEDDGDPRGAAHKTRQGFPATDRTCSRSRTRRGSGRLSSLFSIPFLLEAWLNSLWARIGAVGSWTDVPILVSVAANSVSTCAASDPRSRFFAARFWCAHSAAASPEPSVDFCKKLLSEFARGVQSYRRIYWWRLGLCRSIWPPFHRRVVVNGIQSAAAI